VGLAKPRWRVEHDYRELKDALGLDHFEGRSFTRLHHHVTLASVAHAFVTLERLDPKRETGQSWRHWLRRLNLGLVLLLASIFRASAVGVGPA
jgi:SRSO17 transposase